VARHDTTSTIDVFDSIQPQQLMFFDILNLLTETTTNDCKCLNVLNSVRSDNFQKKKHFRTPVGLAMDMKYDCKAG